MASSFLIPFDGGANTADKKTKQTIRWNGRSPKIVSIQTVECTHGHWTEHNDSIAFLRRTKSFSRILLDLSVVSHIFPPPFHIRVSAHYSILFSFASYTFGIRHTDLYHLVFLFSFDSRLVFDAEEDEKKKNDCKHIRFVKSFRFGFSNSHFHLVNILSPTAVLRFNHRKNVWWLDASACEGTGIRALWLIFSSSLWSFGWSAHRRRTVRFGVALYRRRSNQMRKRKNISRNFFDHKRLKSET